MRYLITLLFFILTGICHANTTPLYFACGPDEDGCSEEYYSSCLCMPVDDNGQSQPYCLDFDTLACVPLALQPKCPRHQIFATQARCVATAFQSEAEPPCEKVSGDFCHQHGIPVCAVDGGIASCH